jgi:nicotinamide mononucleotide transporter
VSFFDIHQILFTAWGYPMSYLEFFGTVAGGVAVWLSAKGHLWSWPLGLINVTLFFFLFFQVQLYPDMFLQVFFFVTNLIGWWRWAHPAKGEEDRKQELKVSYMPKQQRLMFVILAIAGTLAFGMMASHLHSWLPAIFSKPSAFPYMDSFVTVVSILTTYLMVQKKVECWILWIVVDSVATGMYFVKDIRFVAVEYLVFCFIAAFGLWGWSKEFKGYSTSTH